MEAACNVCCEAYNQSSRKRAVCPHCEYAACRTCIRRFITLPGSDLDPSCMNCKHMWHADVVAAAVTKTFVAGEFQVHRENVMFDHETSLMPFTQRTIQASREIAVLNRQLKDMQLEQARIKRRRTVLNLLERGYPEEDTASLPPPDKWRSTVVQGCPSTECKGFITAGRWTCGVCDLEVCPGCREVRSNSEEHGEHVCDLDQVATVKFLQTDTKPCPSCASRIFKISGCDQMWCVKCHAAFSWTTGLVVDVNTEQVHNPEFYRYLRELNNGEIPRDAGEPAIRLQCNVTGPSMEDLENALVNMSGPAKSWIRIFMSRLYHLRVYVVPGAYKTEPQDMTAERRYILLRRKYMLGEVDEETFRALLRTREKQRLRTNEFRELCDTFIQITIDVFNTLKPQMEHGELTLLISQLEAGRDYFNRSMVTLGRRHGGCKRMYVTEGWNTLFVP